MQYFSDLKGANNLIYGNAKGQIRLKIFSKEQFREVLLYTVPDTDKFCRIEQVSVSSDGSMWAAFSTNGYVVYIGTMSESSLISVCHKTSSKIEDIGWMPLRNELIISGGNVALGINYFYLYNPLTRKQTPLSFNQAQYVIISFTFSSDQEVFTLEDRNSPDRYTQRKMVRRYNFTSKELIKYNFEYFFSKLTAKGRVLLLNTEPQNWQRTHLMSEIMFTQQQGELFDIWSSLQKSTVSPNGDYIIGKQAYNYNQYQIYKLCHQTGYFYDKTTQKCAQCSPPCLNCFLDQNRCSSCIDGYQLDVGAQLCRQVQVSADNLVVILVCVAVGIVLVIGGVFGWKKYKSWKNKKNRKKLISSIVDSNSGVQDPRYAPMTSKIGSQIQQEHPQYLLLD